MRHVFAALIRFYQRFISPALGSHCRFEPSCSHYTLQAILRHGSIKGSLLGAWRILRCNPLTKVGQIDPVPPPGKWRPTNEVPKNQVEGRADEGARAGNAKSSEAAATGSNRE